MSIGFFRGNEGECIFYTFIGFIGRKGFLGGGMNIEYIEGVLKMFIGVIGGKYF